MKTQKQNEGELRELTVKIESQVVSDLQTMAENSGLPVEEIVVVALKRYRSSHADYLGVKLDYP
jgi:hypothetical protein